MDNFLMFATLTLGFLFIICIPALALAAYLNGGNQTDLPFDEGYKEQARLARQQAHEGLRRLRDQELELAKGRKS